MDLPRPIRFNAGQMAHRFSGPTDEEARSCNSPDRIARLGASEIGTQGRDRARRSLRADRADRRRQAGLLDEVRQSAGAAATAAAGRDQGGAASGAGSAAKRNFRLVL